MWIRKRSARPLFPSRLPSPMYRSLYSTPSQNQLRTRRDLHPCETLLQRLRDLSFQFDEGRRRGPLNLHQQHVVIEGEEEKVTSIRDGTAGARRNGKNSGSGSSCGHRDGTLEEDKRFPLKKRKSSLSCVGGGEVEASTEKGKKTMKISVKNMKISGKPRPYDGVDGEHGGHGKKTQRCCEGLGDGVASMEAVEQNNEKKKPINAVKHVIRKARSRRSSIVIEGMKMTSINPGKREEDQIPLYCTTTQRRVRRPCDESREGQTKKKNQKKPNDKETDYDMEIPRVGKRPNLILKRRKRSAVIVISSDDEEEEEEKKVARENAIVGKRASRKRLVIDKSDEEQENEQVGAAQALVMITAGDGLVDQGTRCSRYNGRGWRCRQLTVHGYALCDYHLAKARLTNNSSTDRRRGASKNMAPPRRRRSINVICQEERRTTCSSAVPKRRRKGKEEGEEEEDEDEEKLQTMVMRKRGRSEAPFGN